MVERGKALAEQRSELLNLTGPTLSRPLAARLWNPIQGIQTDKFQWMRMEIERHLAGSCEQPIQMARLARPPAGALDALGQLDQGQLDPRSGHDVWLPYLPSHGRRGRHAGGRYGGEGHSSYCKPTVICPLPSSPSPLPFHQPNHTSTPSSQTALFALEIPFNSQHRALLISPFHHTNT